MEPRREALRLGEQPVGGLLRRCLPRLQAGQLVEGLSHQQLEAVELLGEVLHGGGDTCFEFGGLAGRQIAAEWIWGK